MLVQLYALNAVSLLVSAQAKLELARSLATPSEPALPATSKALVFLAHLPPPAEGSDAPEFTHDHYDLMLRVLRVFLMQSRPLQVRAQLALCIVVGP